MVKIAILGAGFMGRSHGTAYQKMDNVEIVAIFDGKREMGQAFAEEYQCRCYDNFDQMIRECDVDVTDICLPTFLHEQFVCRAAAYGKHIFCEKPAALNVASLDRMRFAVRQEKLHLMVGQVLRFWPEYVKARQMYLRGELGKLNYIFAARLSEHPAWSEWYRRPENSGGGLLDLHLHDIDYLYWLLGRVKSVYASGTKNEWGSWNYVNSTLNFESGMTASVQGVIEMEKGYPFTMELRLVGTEKTYEYSMRAGSNLEDVSSAIRETKVYDNGQITELSFSNCDAYEIELKHFVTCIEQDRDSDVINLEQVRDVLCIIEALRHSLETGEKVMVDYKGADI